MTNFSNAVSSIRTFLEEYTLRNANGIPVTFKESGRPAGLLGHGDQDTLVTDKDIQIVLNQTRYTLHYDEWLEELKIKYAKPWLEYKKLLDRIVESRALEKEWKELQEWRDKKWGEKGRAALEIEFREEPWLFGWDKKYLEEHIRTHGLKDGTYYNWELYFVDWVTTTYPQSKLCSGVDIQKIRIYLAYKLKLTTL